MVQMMRRMMTLDYKFTAADVMLAMQMVDARSRSEPRKKSAELEGALGEVAFARVFGLTIPEPERKRSDGGVDYALPSGATVDVKTISGNEPWRLGLLVPKRLRAGIYCLVYVDFDNNSATLCGWQTGGAAASRGEDRGDHWRIKQRDLLPMTDLYRHVAPSSDEALPSAQD